MHRRRQEILLQALSERATPKASKGGGNAVPPESGFRASCAPVLSPSGSWLGQGQLMGGVEGAVMQNARSSIRFSPDADLPGGNLALPRKMEQPCGS